VSPYRFAADSKGNFYVVDPFGAVGVQLFARTGAPVRSIDRRGRGPGEFTIVYTIATGPGDSLHVHGNNYSVFAPGGAHARSIAPPGQIRPDNAVIFLDGRQLIAGYSGTPETFGIPFHLLSATGSIERHFGPPGNSAITANPWLRYHILAAGAGGTFWTGKPGTYAVEQWSIDGTQRTTVLRNAEWFKPWLDWDSRSDIHPPPPRLMAVLEDRQQLLWALLTVPDAKWKASAKGGMATVGEQERRFDSIIEVIDPASRQLLASLRVDGMLVSLFGNSFVAQTREEDSGEVVVDIWQLSLFRR
jgi:hypothetical protein